MKLILTVAACICLSGCANATNCLINHVNHTDDLECRR